MVVTATPSTPEACEDKCFFLLSCHQVALVRASLGIAEKGSVSLELVTDGCELLL